MRRIVALVTSDEIGAHAISIAALAPIPIVKHAKRQMAAHNCPE